MKGAQRHREVLYALPHSTIMPEIEEYIEVARQMAPLFVAAAVVVSVILGLMNRLSESKEEAPVPLILQQAAAAQAAKEKKKKAKEAEEEAKRLLRFFEQVVRQP